ncbi:MAG: hypothetical protein HY331_15275 [Chloroflexi bacterium]|nr:hypothetical protein [Chloroflexota bacterium]
MGELSMDRPVTPLLLAVRLVGLAALILTLVAGSAGRASAQTPADYAVTNGWFYSQANGQGGAGGTGFAVTDDDGILFWTTYKRLGGPQAVGYPVSRRFVWDGFVVQTMQKAIFQWRPEVGQVYFVNVFDRMHDLGKDSWLEVVRATPAPFDTAPDAGLNWEQVKARHWAMLDQNAAIKAAYNSAADPLLLYGLPMSTKDYGNVFVVRAQRAVFQQWKEDVPWAKKGQVTIANGGDIAKEAGLLHPAAIVPQAPGGAEPQPTAPVPTPVPAASAFPYGIAGIGFEPNCGITLAKIYVRDAAGNSINGVRVRLESGTGPWNVVSNPTGSTSYAPGWTDVLLNVKPVANTWNLWVVDDGGNRQSDVASFATDEGSCQPGGSGHQVATVTIVRR